ncbi:LANO_0G14532g1_1 [Lachancea nothofagi CBS 11611]|uniref:LANO_0G14532g1_1 n=1 Tax=Lachancea nothofagi CBS 11611 TaxID=1266666 RepID=A0A1G4KKJ8_9SACH|nr:LANO_0G14532g1_1 [Lachancea nothofagi CBS 11611]
MDNQALALKYMSNAYGASSIMHALAVLNWLILLAQSWAVYCLQLTRSVTLLIYQLSVKPAWKLCEFFLWSPATILFRNLTNLALLPTNVPLILFYNTTLNDIAKVNLHLTTVTVKLCIQYFITMMFIGVIFGIYCGVGLGLLHRFIQIPDKHIEVFGGLTQWLFPHTAHETDDVKANSTPWQYGQYSSPTSDFTAPQTVRTQRRVSRSTLSSVSNVASKLPHDFFQVKSPSTPMRKSNNQKFDPSRLSPMSPEIDDETESMSSNMWDTTEELPETLRTELTGRVNTFPRSYTTSSEQPNYIHLKPLKNKDFISKPKV